MRPLPEGSGHQSVRRPEGLSRLRGRPRQSLSRSPSETAGRQCQTIITCFPISGSELAFSCASSRLTGVQVLFRLFKFFASLDTFVPFASFCEEKFHPSVLTAPCRLSDG